MKKTTYFVCENCGYETTSWLGKCPSCGSWNSLKEFSVQKSPKKSAKKITPVKLSDIKKTDLSRLSTKIGELDRVLGGGFIPGQVILLAGEPGIGKSTLLLQLAAKIDNIAYITGEESASQIKIRADRLKLSLKTLALLPETDINSVLASLERPRVLIIDSIQAMQTDSVLSSSGSVSQVKEAANLIIKYAKKNNIPTIIVGHITKQGIAAGPKLLEHLVDSVIYFEGERYSSLRLLRSVKNRYGPTDEVGVFQMTDKGLREVKNPSELFISQTTKQGKKGTIGACYTVAMEGTRPFVAEIQALVVSSNLAIPRRVVTGLPYNRVQLICAVLQKYSKLSLYQYDIYVSVAGGLKIEEPAADLAIGLAIASSYKNKPLPAKTCAFGEIGLLGEIRKVFHENKRILQAQKLGFNLPYQKKQFLKQVILK